MKELENLTETCPYNDIAKKVVEVALADGQELRFFNNLFIEIAYELIGKEFEFEGTVFKTEKEFMEFLKSVLEWNNELVELNN